MSQRDFDPPPERAPVRFELLPQDASDSVLDLLVDGPLPRVEASEELGAAVSRSLSNSLAFTEASRLESLSALRLLAEIATLDDLDAMRERLRSHQPPFRTASLCRLLIDEGDHLAASDPAQGLVMARLAVDAAELMDSSLMGPRVHADLGADAEAALASALWATGNNEEAETAFRRAEQHLEQGSGTLIALGALQWRRASYLLDCGRLEEAAPLVQEVVTIYSSASLPQELGRGKLLQGRLLAAQNQTDGAVEALDEAAELARSAGDQALLTEAAQHRGEALIAAGQAVRALDALQQAEGLATALGRHRDRGRIRRLIAVALRDREPARSRQALQDAWRDLYKGGHPMEACAALIEAAEALARQREAGSLLELRRECGELFASLAPELAQTMDSGLRAVASELDVAALEPARQALERQRTSDR